MPSETVLAALRDMAFHTDLAGQFVADLAFEAFRDDLRTVYAVTRCFGIIFEVSRRLPVEMKARHPPIPWRQVAAAGNVYRHDYEDIAASYVWRTVQNDLSPLRAIVLPELADGR